jgi:hypothetical protein
MFEPLIIGITVHFISKPPWQLQGTPKMFNLGRLMSEVWTHEKVDPGDLLRKFLLEYERLLTMPADVVRRMLYFEPQHPVPDQEQSRRRGGKRKGPLASTTVEGSLGKQAPIPHDFMKGQDGNQLNQKFAAGGSRYVVIALLGKIKGEPDDRDHVLPCVPVTSSEKNIRALIGRLVKFKKDQGHEDGPAILDVNGRVLSHYALNELLLEILEELFDTHRELFPASILDKEMLQQRVQIY